MRSAAPARDLRGFMAARVGGCACSCDCACAAASVGAAMLKRPRAGGFPEMCLAGPAASVAAWSAGRADWRRAGGFAGGGAALSSAGSPATGLMQAKDTAAGCKESDGRISQPHLFLPTLMEHCRLPNPFDRGLTSYAKGECTRASARYTMQQAEESRMSYLPARPPSASA